MAWTSSAVYADEAHATIRLAIRAGPGHALYALLGSANPSVCLLSRWRLLGAAWVEIDFLEAPHRLPPQLLEAPGQVLCELFVANEQRCESSLGHERMIERQHDEVVIDNVEWVPKLARVANTSEVPDLAPLSRSQASKRETQLSTSINTSTVRTLPLPRPVVLTPGFALYNMVLSSWKVFDKKAFPLKLYIADERKYFNLEWVADLNALHAECSNLIARVRSIPAFGKQEGPGGLMVPVK